MSASLVRKGLELFKDDLMTEKEREKAKKRKKKSLEDPMKLISTKKSGVAKQLRHLKQQHAKKQQTTVKDKHIKSAIEEYKRKRNYDSTADNLYYMTKLKDPTHSKASETIYNHKRKKPIEKSQDSGKSERTLFTDRDFDTFEKEYDFFAT
ncbi:unnamed protein product [Owenia fusiformis]|uniref:Active regulator of SIRT1 n=1 Tax=Owenia fusiformis TaxID=6347 RepID=A0A8S4PNC0_OWEFU|nr:unnamed protein product [Owenia fusiformis]